MRGARDRREWGLQDHLPGRRTCQCLRDLGHLGVDVSGQANEIDHENFIGHVAKDNARSQVSLGTMLNFQSKCLRNKIG